LEPRRQERFRDARRGPKQDSEIRRLYYTASHLNTDGLEDLQGRHVLKKDWKLLLTRAEAPIAR
jgi:hypothetical protein